MMYGAVVSTVSIFQVWKRYARAPSRSTLNPCNSQSVFPANGLQFGPTYSDMRRNIRGTVPGMKKPNKNLEMMKNSSRGENEVRNPMAIIAIIDGSKVLLRPNLKRQKLPISHITYIVDNIIGLECNVIAS